MKISKLFHWLYAIIMLLPIFAIGVTCITNFFNKEDSLIINNKYETNEVNNANDLVIGNIYKVSYENNFTTLTNLGVYKTIYNLEVFSVYKLDIDSYNIRYFRIRANTSILYIMDEEYHVINSYALSNINNPIEFNGVIASNDETLFNGYENLSYSNFNITENIVNEPRENVFYRAVDKVTESPLFSWAYDSFLVAPFSYIVSLFGIPTTHVVVELLSYWLSISIIWLVFDLVMYVPLLVHRWLDKGVLE